MFASGSLSCEASAEERSMIACQVCRKRKIKCGRELPGCLICEQTSQRCQYPAKVLKPGPKIGSTQASRKRLSREDDGSQSQPRDKVRKGSKSVQRDYHHAPTYNPQSLSPGESQPPESPRRPVKNIQNISFIIHPSHESCSPEERDEESPGAVGQQPHENHLISTCHSLGLNPEHLHQLIEMFFENFTSFQLFRKHDLLVKLERITAPAQAKALLAIMLAFATKSGGQIRTINTTTEADEPVSSSYFFDLALESLNIAIHECEDDSMSIPLLQALILITHWLLIKGVRSRAWRYLGIAIRSAYELNLHLIDAGRGSEDQNLDHNQWCEDEERRRAWWAIWEMDVFASVIRRCPTGIDWSQNEAFLPAEDTNWLIGKPQRSCPLELGLNRWKSLEATGNQSPKAWFIVLNSLMKDAQNISSPVGVDGTFTAASSQFAGESIKHHHERRKGTTVTTKVSLNRLSTVQNALHCTVMAIPTVWKYQGQSLDFGTKESNSQAASARKLLHSSIYSINMMTQLAKLMIYKYHVFPSGKVRTTMPANSNLVGGPDEDDASRKEPRGATSVQVDTQALQQYSEAADEIVSMIRKCFGEHYQYLNPFLSNTIWLAAAVQLLYRELAPPGSTDKNLVDSNFEVLRMTHNRFVSYWGMSATLQQNLAVVEHELEILQIRRKEKGIHPQTTGPTLRVSSDKRNRTREDDDRTLTVRVPGSERRMETLGDCVPTPVPRAYSIKSHQDPPDPDPQIFTWLDINQRAQHNNFPALPDPGRQQLFNNHCGLYPPLRAPLLAQSSEQHERQQSQQLALGQPLMNTRLSDVENALSNPDSAAKQIATGPQSIQNSLLRETNQMPYPKGSDAQAPMSPDFLNGFSFSHDIPGPDIDLSSYLDDMLSGSYMT